MIASLAIGGVLLAGMIVATGYAAVRLPGTARVPLHAGMPEYRIWLSKRAGLSAWLAAEVAAIIMARQAVVDGTAATQLATAEAGRREAPDSQ